MSEISRDQFVHLHLHTEFSLLDGACRIDRLFQKIESLGQTAVAITDHGVMYGCVDFFKAAKKHNIKPIIGCEIYVAPRKRTDKIHNLDSSPYHLVLLCKDETGYQNLIKIVSRAYTEGFYNKPRADRELIEQYHKGLIALSACLAGEIPQALMAGNYEAAKEIALYYQGVFGAENYFIELQNHGIQEQIQILPDLIRLANETGIPMVATNDCHYIESEDAQMQKVLICIQTNHTIQEDNALEFKTQNFFVRSTEQMTELFSMVPDAITNTAEIAKRCNFEFEFGNTKLPFFEIPDGLADIEYLTRLSEQGLQERYPGSTDPALKERLDYELSVISKMGFTNYFLIVRDYVYYAKTHDIPVGPGRGSGAGSLVAYCLYITGIDPIKYSLIFERFLNPERVTMPDFDVDFCYEKRQLVFDYVVRKYGADHVAQIVTFGTMKARNAIRDVGRVMAVPYNKVDVIAKLIPNDLGMKIDRALEIVKDLKLQYDSDPEVKALIDMAIKVEGMPRHSSTHAAAVVITPKPVSDFVPLQKSDEAVITQFPMTTIEELGLLKMDFLGLRTLTVIEDASVDIRKKIPGFSIDTIPSDDAETFEMLASGKTEGVFQFESSGMKDLLMGMKPTSIEDLIAAISLYRPGPMDSIPAYLANRANPNEIKYKHKLLEKILSVTNGCIIYQEQVMQIFRELAGFSYGEADIVRRAMSKKKHDVMEREGNKFVEGCMQKGISEKIARSIYDEMASFASYAFNKSHAAAYAIVAYQTAYLRCHHKAQYMAALLTSVLDNTDKITEYIGVCSLLDIKVLPPDINVSIDRFTVDNESIRIGLVAVKNAGRGFIDIIVKEREDHGKYKSFLDFCRRITSYDFSKRAIENLISCGAFDGFTLNRRSMLAGLESVLKSISEDAKKNIKGQLDLFSTQAVVESEANVEIFPEFSERELLMLEKETTGLYLSGHPLLAYSDLIRRVSKMTIRELLEVSEHGYDNESVELLCLVSTVRRRVTKTNSTIAICTIEDLTGSLDMMVFSKKLEDYSALLKENTVLIINGRISVKEDESPKIILNTAKAPPVPSGEQPSKSSEQERKVKKLYIRMNSGDTEIYDRVLAILEIFGGESEVNIYFDDLKIQKRAPAQYNVDVCDTLVNELQMILGAANVVAK